MTWQIEPGAADWEADWEASERFQMRMFSALSLRQKIQAIEDMAEVVRRLEESRRQRGLPYHRD